MVKCNKVICLGILHSPLFSVSKTKDSLFPKSIMKYFCNKNTLNHSFEFEIVANYTSWIHHQGAQVNYNVLYNWYWIYLPSLPGKTFHHWSGRVMMTCNSAWKSNPCYKWLGLVIVCIFLHWMDTTSWWIQDREFGGILVSVNVWEFSCESCTS